MAINRPADSRVAELSGALEDSRRQALEAISRARDAVTRSREMRQRRGGAERAATAAEGEDLREALQRAEEGSAARDRFMAVVAHEMRQPLHAALAALALAQTLLTDQGPARPILVADRQMRRLARLIDDLLDTARTAIEQLDVVVEPTSIGDVMTVVAQEIGPMMTANQRDLIVDAPAQPAWVSVDPLRMNQVFRNLLENASRYTPPGSSIWFTADVHDARVVVHVRDDGPGISAVHRRSIFELFSRGTTGGDGVGIGLALARSLVERQGGSLALADGGRGSDFLVTLPRCPAPPAG
jgi:signal transduction histidine kinase